MLVDTCHNLEASLGDRTESRQTERRIVSGYVPDGWERVGRSHDCLGTDRAFDREGDAGERFQTEYGGAEQDGAEGQDLLFANF